MKTLLIPFFLIIGSMMNCDIGTGPDCIPSKRTSYVVREYLREVPRFAPAYCVHPDDRTDLLICLYLQKFNCYSGDTFYPTVCSELDSSIQNLIVAIDSLNLIEKGKLRPQQVTERHGKGGAGGTFQARQLKPLRIYSRGDSILTTLYLSTIDSVGKEVQLAPIERWLFRITDPVWGVETFYTGHLYPRSEIDSFKY